MHDNKMPCSISDGPQEPGDEFELLPIENDEAFDEEIQRRLDAGLCRWCGVHPVPDWGEQCHQCKVEQAEMMEDR